MSAPSWPPEVARAWVYHELLRRLGFRPGDLYVGVVRGDFAGAATRVVRVELRAQGREFGVHVAPWTAPRAAFEAAWTAFVAALRSGATTDADLQALWDAHRAAVDAGELLRGLLTKGFELPRARATS